MLEQLGDVDWQYVSSDWDILDAYGSSVCHVLTFLRAFIHLTDVGVTLAEFCMAIGLPVFPDDNRVKVLGSFLTTAESVPCMMLRLVSSSSQFLL
jgi:hypothetical protein